MFLYFIFYALVNVGFHLFNFFIVDTIDLRNGLLASHATILIYHIPNGFVVARSTLYSSPVFTPSPTFRCSS